MKFPLLYKRDTTGGVRTWQLELNADGVRYRTLSGTLGGKVAESGWTTPTPKNVGRANETTPESQAQLEIAAEYTKKRDRGYFDQENLIDTYEATKPMLAQDYAKLKAPVRLPVFAQPKLDGIRCIARADGLWTRTGKKITAVPHIWDALFPLFEEEPDLILDGELYNHDLREDFNEITSIVRKAKPNAAELAKAAEMIQYHIYDMPSSPEGFYKRYIHYSNLVDDLDHPAIWQVETHTVKTYEGLDGLYARWLEQGYEGQMIRLDQSYEIGKRSKALLKRKEFFSDEFEVANVEEGDGNWSGAVKRFVLKMKDGRTFGAGVRGSKETLTALLHGDKPTWATVRYFTPTPDNIPRFPVVVDYGTGSRKD